MATTSLISNIGSGITNLIFPLLVAVLGTQIWNFILERKKKEIERKEKLYRPLRFYLMLMKYNRTTTKNLREEMFEVYKERTKNINKVEAGNILIENSNKFSKEIDDPALNEWWLYVHKINDLLENYSGLIKKDDWPLIQEFTHGSFLRKFVVGEKKQKDIFNLLKHETGKNGIRKIFDTIDKLQDKILRE